ncbi:MAG: amidohydrolase family protein [Bacteroidota bacterium]|nr:amidohydrolase family protein [Bacteroidota bacterium]
MKKLVIGFVCLCINFSFSQSTFPANGAPNPIHTTFAFINAVIHVDENTTMKNGTLIIKDGKIVDVIEKGVAPKNAIVFDLKGKHVYASFIDLYTEYGISETNENERRNRRQLGPQMESNVKGAYGWNQAIKSDVETYKYFVHQTDQAEAFKKTGIGSVLSAKKDGIVRGTGVLVNLNNAKENESIITDKCAAFYSLNKGSSTQDYPSSLTGCIALLRQTYYDAQWYKTNAGKVEFNISLDQFNQLQSLPGIIESNERYNNSRITLIAKEFNTQYILKVGNADYQRIEDLKNIGAKCIVPVNFPEAYDVEDPFDADNISLADLKHWEMAPGNLAAFEKNNISFCITSADLKDKKVFLSNIRKAITCGLSEKMALKALTTNPAQFVNAETKIGSLKKDMYANFFISSSNIFEEEASILEHWVNGQVNTFVNLYGDDVRGNYSLITNKQTYSVQISGDEYKPKAIVKVDTAKVNANFILNNSLVSFNFAYDSSSVVRMNLVYNKTTKGFSGTGTWPNGDVFNAELKFVSVLDTSKGKSKSKTNTSITMGKVLYPFSSYGIELPADVSTYKDLSLKTKRSFLIKGATVWTNEKDSIISNCDVLIIDGKINKLGANLPSAPGVQIIEAKGLHLTPGIIDEHSHIALWQGVNEGAQASSAEVKMGDVIWPEDINIYRQLAGGVTCSQLLHGSANPIGGQSALIKLRWGQNAEGMKYQNADGFIKFALGENVKQSNWGDFNSIRFPQTRMGVEQVYKDFFTRAKEYHNSLTSATPKKVTVRKDLELEALAEILNKKRFITCHSYVQSEINMLMHVADSFGFKVNTFTHILEGYKVADKMKAHGVSASTFSDWWAYKNEVMDAIPYNSAILTKVGVNTSVNSDDAEMARRLNQEAAKAIKYGGLTEVEALKLATLNPAKMLHINDKVGSIKVGKDADIVLWTDNPLSIYAKVDKTFIEGKIYFDREQDRKLQEYTKNERARLIAKLIAEKQKGGAVTKFKSKRRGLYHCETLEGVSEEKTGVR